MEVFLPQEHKDFVRSPYGNLTEFIRFVHKLSKLANLGNLWRLVRRPLPVAAEVHARPGLQRQPNDAPNLLAVVIPAMALAIGTLLRVAGQIHARDVVMVADFGAAQPAKEALRAARAGDAVAV